MQLWSTLHIFILFPWIAQTETASSKVRHPRSWVTCSWCPYLGGNFLSLGNGCEIWTDLDHFHRCPGSCLAWSSGQSLSGSHCTVPLPQWNHGTDSSTRRTEHTRQAWCVFVYLALNPPSSVKLHPVLPHQVLCLCWGTFGKPLRFLLSTFAGINTFLQRSHGVPLTWHWPWMKQGMP